MSLTRRRLLAGLGAVGAAAALGTGVTVAALRDGEPLPPAVVESGDVRFVGCTEGSRSLDEFPLDFDLDEDNGFRDERSTEPFGVETVPAWLVARVCPSTDETIAASLRANSTVSVWSGDDVVARGRLGERVVAAVDPGDCDTRVSVVLDLDEDTTRSESAVDAVNGYTGEWLGSPLQLYAVQRTGVPAAVDARAWFETRFGGCGPTAGSAPGSGETPGPDQGSTGRPGRDPNGRPGHPGARP